MYIPLAAISPMGHARQHLYAFKYTRQRVIVTHLHRIVFAIVTASTTDRETEDREW